MKPSVQCAGTALTMGGNAAFVTTATSIPTITVQNIAVNNP